MIRVIIERQIKANKLEDYFELIRRARQRATTISGYIAGELLQEKGTPNHAVIISSWETLEAWEEWFASDKRADVMQSMSEVLETPEKITILENSHFAH